MIRRLQMKFIAVSMGVLVIVFLVVFLTLNIFMQTSSTRQTENLLQKVAEQDNLLFPPREFIPRPGMPPMNFGPEPEMIRAGRFFYVKYDQNHEILETNFERMFDFSKEEAIQYGEEVLNNGRPKGNIGNLQYLIVEKNYGKIIVFAERSIEIGMLSQLIQVSVWVSLGTFIVLLIFSFFFSRWAVKPVAIAFEKQKRFISDASHELKMPLTIIGANIDVLENEYQNNRCLASIKEQSKRMNLLIQDLLTLARADEADSNLIMSEFNLSKTIENTILEFESTAFEADRQLDFHIETDINYYGCEPQVKQLVSILVDNALKHSDPKSTIQVTLKKSNESPKLTVYNTGSGISDYERERIFDRFYRSDDSRSRATGGYGLGLAIAKSIVESHQGKISVNGKAGHWVEFQVIL